MRMSEKFRNNNSDSPLTSRCIDGGINSNNQAGFLYRTISMIRPLVKRAGKTRAEKAFAKISGI